MTISREEWLAGGSRVPIPGGRHTLFVRQDGPADGSPVTLLHGFPTSSHDWAGITPFLTAHRVTALDFLGYGNSDKPHPYDYTLQEQADLVEAIWRQSGITSTALVAHDYGVSVAQELLARAPERITSVAWLNGGLFPDLHRPTSGQKLLRGPFGPIVARLFDEGRFAAAIREILGRQVSDEAMHEMWLSMSARKGVRTSPRMLRYLDERREYAGRWRAAIEHYAGPQLFVWGPVDPVSGAHVVPRIREVAPGAEVVVLDEAPAVGHYPQVEAPEVVGPLIAGFLS